MKSDVKPVVTSSTNAVFFTGPTRLRGYMIQSTGSSGTAIINGLLNTPEGTVGDYGLLGAANLANTADESRRRAGDAFDSLDANQQRVLSELYNSYLRDANSGGFDLTGSYDFGGGDGGGGKTDYWTSRAVNAE